MLIRLYFITALFLVQICLNAQSFTVNGYKWDTIYIGGNNSVEIHGIDCDKLKCKIVPGADILIKGCILSISPYFADTTYWLTLIVDGKEISKVKFYSSRWTLTVLSLANILIPLETDTIPLLIAKQLRGVKPIINCPWLRDYCTILGYTFIIQKGSEVIYNEEIIGWQLSIKAKDELQNIRPGTTIVFDDIKRKCPGDDANGISEIKFTLK